MLAAATALLLVTSAAPVGEAPARMRPRAPFPSLLAAATIPDGGSAFLFTAGVPFLSASYAQGLSDKVDAGGQLELDWLTSELFAGGTLRRFAGRQGDLFLALRGRAGALFNGGADWAVSQNRADVGLQVAPGAVASLALRRGTLSFSADVPVTLTTARGGGVGLAPRAAVSFETPLLDGWSAGARVGALWAIATGGAPFEGDPRASVDFAAVFTYRLF